MRSIVYQVGIVTNPNFPVNRAHREVVDQDDDDAIAQGEVLQSQPLADITPLHVPRGESCLKGLAVVPGDAALRCDIAGYTL